MNQIHGHEVMQMMIASGKRYTKKSLTEDIIQTFGNEARFYTCSAENLTPEGIIEFLESRGKFLSDQEGFQTSEDQICRHE